MSEEDKNLFAEMFGDGNVQKKDEKNETPSDQTPKSDPVDEKEATPNENSSENAPKDEKKVEEFDQNLIDEAKKELGIGGAAFCDELLASEPNAVSLLKEAGKTLHGFFNFAYSYAMDEYVKAHGRVNGGGYWNLTSLLEKYLDPSVKEGFTVNEPKAKPHVPPKQSESAVKTIENVAKKAAKAAKAAKSSRTKKSSVKKEGKPEIKIVEPPVRILKEDDSDPIFKKFDFSKLMSKMKG